MQIELNCILLAPHSTFLSVLFGAESQPVSVYTFALIPAIRLSSISS